MSNVLPKNKNAYRFFEGMKDPNFDSKRSAFKRDGVNTYKLETDDYVAFVLTNEGETHYYWYIVYTEGDMNNNIKYDDTNQSQVDFLSFEECIDDMNRCLSKQDDSNFFEKSRYKWHIKPTSNNGINAILYMQTKRGVKLGLELSKDSRDADYTYYGFWNYNSNMRDVGGKVGVTISELEEKYLGSSFCPKIKDINTIDSFIDEVRLKTGISPSKRF